MRWVADAFDPAEVFHQYIIDGLVEVVFVFFADPEGVAVGKDAFDDFPFVEAVVVNVVDDDTLGVAPGLESCAADVAPKLGVFAACHVNVAFAKFSADFFEIYFVENFAAEG